MDETGGTKRTVVSALFVIGALLCLTPWGSPPIALALGILLALTLENPFAKQAKKYSGNLLRSAVVLLGFTMDLSKILQAGENGILFSAITIFGTLALGYAVGKALRVEGRTSMLISSGTAICGGSAIAAVGSVLGAQEGEMSVALGAVFMLNAVALYLFPVIGHALAMQASSFGTWAGIAIHDISSVVGAASVFGKGALETATAVKLSRTLWIVPLAFGAALAQKKTSQTKIQVPWFIGFFLVAALLRSEIPAMAPALPALAYAAKAGMTLTLYMIGSSLSRAMLKSVGVRPLVQAVLLWVFISGISLFVITR